MLILINLYYRKVTLKSLENDLKSYEFIAERFAKVNQCWLKYPWRNLFLYDVWGMKKRGVPCHLQNLLLQHCLRNKFGRREIRTKATRALKKGIIIHFYSQVKIRRKWMDVDVWGKKWGVPFGRNIHNAELR